MPFFSVPKIDKFGLAALLLLVLAVPIYAVSSYQGTVETSVSRWLALYLIGTEAAVVILALLSGWRPTGSFNTLPKNVRIALTLWLFVASTATALSSKFDFSAIFQLFWIVHGVFCWALWAMLRTRWSGMERPLLVYFSLGLIIYSLMVYFVAWVLLGLDVNEWEPYSVGTTNPRNYTFYAAALLGMGLGFLIIASNKTSWLFALFLTFCAYHLFAWSGGRASFGTSLIVPLLVALWCREKWKRVLPISYLCAAIAYPLSLFSAPAHGIFGFRSIISRIAAGEAGGNAYSSGRLDLWTSMLVQSLEKPIFGHGQIGTLDLPQDMHARFGDAISPHNAVVHIVHAWGALGLIVFAVGLLPFLPTIRYRLESRPAVAWPAFATLLTLAVTSALDSTLFYNQSLFFCALCIAILASVPTTPVPAYSGPTAGKAPRGAQSRNTSISA